MSNVIYVAKFFKNAIYKQYCLKYDAMHKDDLIEEMLKFQRERLSQPSLTLGLVLKGIPLFKNLENKAETFELKQLALNYRKKLEQQLEKI